MDDLPKPSCRDPSAPTRPLHWVLCSTSISLNTPHATVNPLWQVYMVTEHGDQCQQQKYFLSSPLCLSTHDTSPILTHTCTHTRLITPWHSSAVREASFQTCTTSCGALVNALGTLSPEPGAGKRHSHFLPFSTTGFRPGEAGNLGTKMLPGGTGNSHPRPHRPLSSGQESA